MTTPPLPIKEIMGKDLATELEVLLAVTKTVVENGLQSTHPPVPASTYFLTTTELGN